MARRRKNVERELTRRIILTYLQSIQVVEGDRPAEDFFDVGVDYSPLSKLSPKNEKQKTKIDDILSTKFPYNPDPQKRRNSDTGWILSEQYNQVDWSKVAYRIGVREVGLNSFEFADVSSRVSVPITSPKPIWKMVLRATEDIPSSFDRNQAWIHYHVSIDDGKSWFRLNPTGKPTRFADDGTVVPKVLTINAEVPSADAETRDLSSATPVKTVRLRYTLYKDTSVDNAIGVTPVLKNVQLLLYPRGGISGAQDQEAV